jgi:hypothetical protein
MPLSRPSTRDNASPRIFLSKIPHPTFLYFHPLDAAAPSSHQNFKKIKYEQQAKVKYFII